MRFPVLWLLGVAGLLSLIQACGPKVEPQESCNFVQNGALQRVSWKHNVPAKVYVHKSVPPSYHGAIERAVKHWNESSKRTLLVVEAWNTSGVNQVQKDGYSTIYWSDTWEEGKTKEQARTTIYWTGNRIYEADIKVNAKDFDYVGASGNETQWGHVDFESLMVHELGHSLGLAHQEKKDSVMKKVLLSATLRRDVGGSDKSSLSCEY